MSLELKNASIIFDHSQHTPESLAEAIEDMGFDSILSDTTTASEVPTDTQLFPTPALLTPEAQQEALARLAQLQGVLEVQENKDQRGVSITFIPALIGALQLGEVVSSLASFLEVPTEESLVSVPDPVPASVPALVPGLAPVPASIPALVPGLAPVPASVPALVPGLAPVPAPVPALVPGLSPVPAPAISSQVKMGIEGMVCLSCTTTIEGKIGKLKGVEKIKGYFVIA